MRSNIGSQPSLGGTLLSPLSAKFKPCTSTKKAGPFLDVEQSTRVGSRRGARGIPDRTWSGARGGSGVDLRRCSGVRRFHVLE